MQNHETSGVDSSCKVALAILIDSTFPFKAANALSALAKRTIFQAGALVVALDCLNQRGFCNHDALAENLKTSLDNFF
jgi:hypothetical protein